MKLTWDSNSVIKLLPEFIGKDFAAENDRPSAVAFDAGRLCFAGTNNEPNRIYMSRAPDSQTGETRHMDFSLYTTYFTPKQDDLIPRLEAMTVKLHTIAAKQESGTSDLDTIIASMDKIADNSDYLALAAMLKIFGRKSNIVAAKLNVHMAELDTLSGELGELLDEHGTLPGELGELLDEFSELSTKLETVKNELIDIAEYIFAVANIIEEAEFPESLKVYRAIPEQRYLLKIQTAALIELVDEQEIMVAKIEAIILRLPKNAEEEETYVTLASDAILIEENDMHGSRIQWIAANRHFLAATERATWSDTGDIPTPATFDMNIIEYAGSNGIQAKGTKEIMVYAGRNGKSLRALVWNENTQGSGYIDMDISEQAAHLFSMGIKDFAVMDYPYPMLWVVTDAGELVSLTVNIRSGILAYARHPTDGEVESIAIAPRKDGDFIFLTVKRGNVRNIEHMVLEDLVNEDFTNSHYVDSGEMRNYSEPIKTIADLQRFAGMTIRAFTDGAVEPPIKVSDEGTIELQTAVSKIHLGLPYKAAFSPNERQIPANGTSLGKKRRIEKITLRMYKSIGGKAGTAEGKVTELITQRFGRYELGSAPEPFTGDIDITVSGNIDTEGKLTVTHDEPAPFTMLALTERVTILEV
jgi:hypothetical protein